MCHLAFRAICPFSSYVLLVLKVKVPFDQWPCSVEQYFAAGFWLYHDACLSKMMRQHGPSIDALPLGGRCMSSPVPLACPEPP